MSDHGYLRVTSGLVHKMRDAETSECGRQFRDGRRVGRSGKVGMCARCRRVVELRSDLLARAGGEAAKMRLIRELADIVNRPDDDK